MEHEFTAIPYELDARFAALEASVDAATTMGGIASPKVRANLSFADEITNRVSITIYVDGTDANDIANALIKFGQGMLGVAKQ